MDFLKKLFPQSGDPQQQHQETAPHEFDASQSRGPKIPQDVIDEIARLAVSDYDRQALLARVSIERPQVARALVFLSGGSIGHLEMLFRESYAMRTDDRDVLMIAHQQAPYDAGYFIDPFPVIKQRPRQQK